MSIDKRLASELNGLPMDVFELAEHGLEVESLTAGHGMTEVGASCGVHSCSTYTSSSSSCPGCC